MGSRVAPVSVIIATYNRGAYIDEAISGMLEQSMRPKQIIVVNDGSDDDTEVKLDRYKNCIDVISQKNNGKSAAINNGLQYADEKFVWVFDDDDIPLRDALARHVEALESAPDAGFTISPYIKAIEQPDGNLREVEERQLPDIEPECVFSELLRSCFLTQQGSVARRECFQKVGQFREDLDRSLDYEYLIRLARFYKSVRIDKPTFIFRAHSGPRGRKSQRFSATDKSWHWHIANKTIFGELYDKLDLSEYLPSCRVQAASDAGKQRLALLERAVIMARKGLWVQCLMDLEHVTKEHVTKEDDRARSWQAMFEKKVEECLTEQLAVRDLICNWRHIAWFRRILRQWNDERATIAAGRRLYHHIVAEKRERNIVYMSRILLATLVLLGGKNSIMVGLRLRKKGGAYERELRG